jgi:excisionase family DNA binding protein
MLSIGDVARHWSVSAATVRAKICGGALRAVRVGGRYRTTWPDVWACEEGRRPGRHEAAAYAAPLLTVPELSAAMGVSRRTVERWIEAGLPTRRVGVLVRFSRAEAEAWLGRRFGVGLDGAAA